MISTELFNELRIGVRIEARYWFDGAGYDVIGTINQQITHCGDPSGWCLGVMGSTGHGEADAQYYINVSRACTIKVLGDTDAH